MLNFIANVWSSEKTSYLFNPNAEIAQLVERNLAKVKVAGPSPVFRSNKKADFSKVCFFLFSYSNSESYAIR